MRQLFYTDRDVWPTWGQVTLRPAPARVIAAAPPLPFLVRHTRRLEDGSFDVLGVALGRNAPWSIVRARTRDGIHLTEQRTVHYEAGEWGYSATITHSPQLGRYVCLKNTPWHTGDGFTTHAFVSDDGESWTAASDDPVFREGDAWSAVWSPELRRFICYNKALEWGEEKQVHELFRNARRVVGIRTSPDGVHWQPDAHSDYTRGLEKIRGMAWIRAPLAAREDNIGIDRDADPPDLEFYNGTVFRYAGRYFMSATNYAGTFLPPGFSPMRIDGHASAIGNELWVSDDGVHWQRPYRHISAGVADRHEPMLLGDVVAFRGPTELVGFGRDRIAYATAWSNAVFDTASFRMSAGGLYLNLRVPVFEADAQSSAAYVMAELIDDKDEVVKGYDREACVMQAPLDQLRWQLRWDGRDGSDLDGERVRLRLYLRAAALFALYDEDGLDDGG